MLFFSGFWLVHGIGQRKDFQYSNIWSHAHTVVWECCKDDRKSQWEMAKLDPQPTLNP